MAFNWSYLRRGNCPVCEAPLEPEVGKSLPKGVKAHRCTACGFSLTPKTIGARLALLEEMEKHIDD